MQTDVRGWKNACAAAVLLVFSAGCNAPSGNTPKGRPPGKNGAPLTLQAIVDAPTFGVGERVRARCVAWQDEAILNDVVTSISISPEAPVAVAASVETIYVPERTGAYTVQCSANVPFTG